MHGVGEFDQKRYEILRSLGQGSFGDVLLTHDRLLDREVAIKSIRADVESGHEPDLLTEARILARLNHPGIVAVHDIVRRNGVLCFVFRHVEGKTITEYAEQIDASPRECAALVARVADALSYAHSCGVLHRDVTSANILIASDGSPVLVDFGLALAGGNTGDFGLFVGTPGYASPEQARGETHLVDERTDVYGLGAVLYELLAEEIPPDALSGASPRPVRELNPSLPASLERICNKALAEQVQNRYANAAAFAEDLRLLANESDRLAEDSADLAPEVIPRGLRSFNESDSDFYLTLLPGFRDREGVPDSIRFWHRGLDTPGEEFRVGALYGPSGSGKSSFLRAGLLPRLGEKFDLIYVSADSGDLECRLGDRLSRLYPIGGNLSLADAIGRIRRENLPGSSRKLLLVIDQFEQWLHARPREQRLALTHALRQCDGETVQAILVSRDDFWTDLTAFFSEIDVPLEPARNATGLDLFEVAHARKVLIEFGRAYGRIELENPDTAFAFVDAALGDMAKGEKVVPVQLALFADMAKSVPWTPESFRKLGGATAIGVEFLDATLSQDAANPVYRNVHKEARAILKALSPPGRSSIRRTALTRARLLERANLDDNDRAEEALRVLDVELKLVTPVGTEENPDAVPRYQLTHDFLLRPLRFWLGEQEKRSLAGRARLRLEERTSFWEARKENRQLPSLWEWLRIVFLVDRSHQDETEREMMAAATKLHFLHIALSIAVISSVIFVFSSFRQAREDERRTQEVENFVEDLERSGIYHLPEVLANGEAHRSRWRGTVVKWLDDESDDKRLRAALALQESPGHTTEIVRGLLVAESAEFRALLDLIGPSSDEIVDRLRNIATSTGTTPPVLVRACSALARMAPEALEWKTVAPGLVAALTEQGPLDIELWVRYLSPVHLELLPAAGNHCSEFRLSEAQRHLASSLFIAFGAGRAKTYPADRLLDLFLESDEAIQQILLPAMENRKWELNPLLLAEVEKSIPSSYGPPIDEMVTRCAVSAVLLFRFGREWPLIALLRNEEDPRAGALATTHLPALLRNEEAVRSLLDRYGSMPYVRRAVFSALPEIVDTDPRQLDQLHLLAKEAATNDLDAGARSMALWAAQRLGSNLPPDSPAPSDAKWFNGPLGLTFVQISAPGEILVGSPEDEPGRDFRETRKTARIDRPFAISTTEVPLEAFLKFDPGFQYSSDITRGDTCPVTRISLFDAMRFCRWLSERDPEIDLNRCCYPAEQLIKPNMELEPDFHKRPGYRLPMTEEWEYACRAKSQTSRFFGDRVDALGRFAWHAGNANDRVWPVGLKQPNPFGLFDVYGNVGEWTHRRQRGALVEEHLRGGDYRSTPRFLRSAMPRLSTCSAGTSVKGFRVVLIRN